MGISLTPPPSSVINPGLIEIATAPECKAEASQVLAMTPGNAKGTYGLNFIQSFSCVGVQTIAVVLPMTDYDAFMLVGKSMHVTTDDSLVNLELSNNGGSSYFSSGYSYTGTRSFMGGAAATVGLTGQNFARLVEDAGGARVGNNTNEGFNFLAYAFGPMNPGSQMLKIDTYWNDPNGVQRRWDGMVQRADTFNALRFSNGASNNFTAGTISLFGIRT